MALSIKDRPILKSEPIKNKSAIVEYDFFNTTSAKASVIVMALPTHPINNNFNVRCAISIDNGPLKTLDIKTFGRSEEWKQDVLKNRAVKSIDMQFLPSGKHTLKIYSIDPGIILDEIRIDLGGTKRAYGELPETKINK